jgi:hypothetical protein
VVHVGKIVMLGRQRGAEVMAEVAGGEAGVVFHLGGEGELAQRERAALAIVFGDGAFEHQRIEVGAGGVDGGGPAGRAATDDDDVLGNGGGACGHELLAVSAGILCAGKLDAGKRGIIGMSAAGVNAGRTGGTA